MASSIDEIETCPECGFPQQEWRKHRGRRLHLSTCPLFRYGWPYDSRKGAGEMSVDDWTVTVEVDAEDLKEACKAATSHIREAKRAIRQIEDWGYSNNLDSWRTLCEVNGIPVLQRNTETGELHAADDLEGIAAYFESGGTVEQLYWRERFQRRVLHAALGRIVNGAVEEPTDRDEDGVAQGGFVRQMTRSEMIDVAWAALQKVRGASDE